MLPIVLAMSVGQATSPPVLPRFPGCPPAAVSSLCAPPPPPPPHRWDDHDLEATWTQAFAEFLRLSSDVTRRRFSAFEAQKEIAGAAIGSAAWEAQRQRMLGVLATERQIATIRLNMIITANGHRAGASAGDMAEYDRFTAMLDSRRKKLAMEDRTILYDLIDRPAATAH